MKTKNFVLLIVAIMLVGGAIGGAFIGGQAIGKNSAREEASQTLQNRLDQFGVGNGGRQGFQQGIPPQGSRLPGAAGDMFIGGGAIGTVEKIESNVLTLNTQNGTKVRVILSDNTTIEKMAPATIGDILVGSSVTIGGQRNADGSIQATTIFMTRALNAQ